MDFNAPSPRLVAGGRAFRAVVFDMDGLMFDTERLYRDAMASAAQEFGADVTHEIFVSLIGRGWTESQAILRREFGQDFPIDGFAAATDRLVSARVEREGVPHKPGLLRLLELFRTLDVPCAVATSTRNPRATHKLTLGGIHGFFRHIITGDQVERGKPAPDIYLKATAALGVAPAEALAFEDSPNGLRAATSAGIVTILVPDLAPINDEVRALAWHVLPSLEHARELVGK